MWRGRSYLFCNRLSLARGSSRSSWMVKNCWGHQLPKLLSLLVVCLYSLDGLLILDNWIHKRMFGQRVHQDCDCSSDSCDTPCRLFADPELVDLRFEFLLTLNFALRTSQVAVYHLLMSVTGPCHAKECMSQIQPLAHCLVNPLLAHNWSIIW